MASTNIILRRSLKLIDCCSSQKSLKWNYLMRNLHSFFCYSSTFGFSSSLKKGRNIKSIPKVPHVNRSNFPNLSKPRLYNAFVKPHIDIDSLIEPKSSVIKIQDNLEDFLSSELPTHPKLVRGQLKNGLRYCILQHKKQPNRFKASLEVHVGTLYEDEDEQGIAHMTEHVLESDKCSQIFAVGADGSAYTGYRHTVYHLTSQTIFEHFDKDLFHNGVLVDGDLVPYVLDALNEQAFKPKIRASHLEKQRHIVLSELQMWNTIEERVVHQERQHLHSENKLSKRSVLGLEDQIKKWDVAQIKKFHKRWHFPANATLYIVGDINDVSKTIDAIQVAFGKSKRFPRKRLSEIKNECPTTCHNWSLPPSNVDDKKTTQIFQHELVHNFSFRIFSKFPITKFRTYGDLRNFIMKEIYLSVLCYRLDARYKSSNSSSTLERCYIGDFDYYGCTLTHLTVTSEPKDWKTAIKLAFHEVRRLNELGINYGEFTLHKDAILKKLVYHIAVSNDCLICETMNFIMEKDALNHTIMEESEAHESLVGIAATITLEETNSIGRELLEFVSDFGKPSAPVPKTIMVCAPTTHEVKGELVEFSINPNEIESAMKEGLEELIYAKHEIEVPIELISSSQLQKLWLERQPSFIPLASSKPNVKKFHDNQTDHITQRRLSNGISINYKISENERNEGVIRVIIGGGTAFESSYLKGATAVGILTLCEGGSIGHFSKEQVELFCLKNQIEYYMDATEEFIYIELSFPSKDNRMQAAFQLLHMLLEHSIWLEDAFDRAKQLYLSEFKSNSKSLEQSTIRKLKLAMLDGDKRFVEPTQISLQNLTLQSVKKAVLNQLTVNNMEVSIVGDFSKEDLESSIINYLGTIKATGDFNNELHKYEPTMRSVSPSHLQSQIYLKDTEERAYACIAGLTPNNWGFTIDGKHCFDSKCFIERECLQSKLRNHPLFFAITMEFLTFMIQNSLRKYTIACGLAYEVELDFHLFHKLNLGWYMISIASTPCKVRETVDICKKVLKDFRDKKIYQTYLDQIRGCLLIRYEDESKSNAYWLKLLCHLQAASASRKDLLCIKDIAPLYKVVGIDDIYFVYDQLKINDDSIYSCIGIAGQHENTGK